MRKLLRILHTYSTFRNTSLCCFSEPKRMCGHFCSSLSAEMLMTIPIASRKLPGSLKSSRKMSSCFERQAVFVERSL